MNARRKRRLIEGAKAAARARVKHCKKCERGQTPKIHRVIEERIRFWICRYCKHEN